MRAKLLLLLFALSTIPAYLIAQIAQPGMPAINKRVNSIVRYHDKVIVGGEFDSIGLFDYAYLAAIDANTGAVLNWLPRPNRRITKIIIAGNKIVVGGSFDSISGAARQRIAVYDAQTLTLLNSGINRTWYGGDALHQDGNWIYYNAFDTIIGDCIARFDINTLQSDNWQTEYIGYPVINSITAMGNYIYIGGSLSWIGNNSLFENLARFDKTTGLLDTTWFINCSAVSYISEIVAHNGKIYAAGNYSQIGGLNKNGMAEIDTAGFVTGKNFGISNSQNEALVLNGNTLWIGGNSSTIGGQFRQRIAQVNINTGSATCWDISGSGVGNVSYVGAICVQSDTVYTGTPTSTPFFKNFKAFTGNSSYINIGNDTVLCAGSTLTLNAPSGLTNYLWNTGATTSSITISSPGTYWFSATGTGCIVTGFRIIDACTGIEEEVSYAPVQARPTISNGIYTINLPDIKGAGKMLIYDSKGNLTSVFPISPHQTEKRINITSAAKGLYLCRIIWDDNLSFTLKFVKE